MANVKISDLAAFADPVGDDVFPIVDTTADSTKKVSITTLMRSVPDGSESAPAIAFRDDGNTGFYTPAANEIGFVTGGVQRVAIKNNGDIGFIGGVVGPSSTEDRAFINASEGNIYLGANDTVAAIFNRNTTDGSVVQIRQADTIEGTIAVSGTTVSYNGAHLSRWSQLPSNAERIQILRGTVLSNLDEMCEWGEEDNEQLNRMKVSDVEGDVNVAGVFQDWDDDDDTYLNDFHCAMTGDFVIRIAQGTTVGRGDLLMSAGDGTAKPQDDDIVRSKTVAKVTSTTVSATYADGSYCVPCVLMAC